MMRVVVFLSLSLIMFCVSDHFEALAEAPVTLKGKLVYFGRADDADGGKLAILAQSRNGVTETVATIESAAHSGRVSPQGDRLAFWGEINARRGIWLMSEDGAKRTWLVEAPEDSWIGGWSPDGERLVFGHGDSEHRTNLLVDVKARVVQPLRMPASEAIWDWSPDGTEYRAPLARA